MKISLAVAGALMLASTLTACGGGDGGNDGEDGDYCKDAQKASSSFEAFAKGDITKVESIFATVHTLAEEAPGDVEKDWKTLDDVILAIEKAFKGAGLKLSDLDDVQKGQVPEGADPSRLQSLPKDFQKLSDADYTGAAKRIDAHAKKVCKVTLHVAS
jgi:hypothetical protein